jgi:hypothetical protein
MNEGKAHLKKKERQAACNMAMAVSIKQKAAYTKPPGVASREEPAGCEPPFSSSQGTILMRKLISLLLALSRQ